MVIAISILVAALVTIALTFGNFAKSHIWRATVTPLASIIGSGFLICGPLLAREFGSGAIAAMALLLLIAYAAGAVLRYNIVHVENHSVSLGFHDRLAWAMRVAQIFSRSPMPCRWHIISSCSQNFCSSHLPG